MSIFDSPADKAFKRFDDVLARFDVERERASQMSHRAWDREKFLEATSDLANDETDEDALEAVVESAPTGETPYTTEEFMAHTVCVHALTEWFGRLTLATADIREVSALANSSRRLFDSEVALYESAIRAYSSAAEIAKRDAKAIGNRELAVAAYAGEKKAARCLELVEEAAIKSMPKGGLMPQRPAKDTGWLGAIVAMVGLIFIVAGFAGLIGFHLYTAWLINNANGPFWGVIAFLTPPISDFIWMGVEVRSQGLFTFYFACLAAPVLAYGLGFACFKAAGGSTS